MTSLTLVRTIAARPSIVFDALITPEGMAQWWGPGTGLAIAEADTKVGGAFKVRFGAGDGNTYETRGTFLVIDPPHRVVLTWQWQDDEDGHTSEIEMTLRPVGEGTELSFTHAKLPDAQTAAGHAKGWNRSLDKLVAYLAPKT